MFCRHFPGELLSVKTTAVNACPGLFHLNERVAWIGNWQHGFFSMTAVGATNVGSIHMDNEKNIGEANENQFNTLISVIYYVIRIPSYWEAGV